MKITEYEIRQDQGKRLYLEKTGGSYVSHVSDCACPENVYDLMDHLKRTSSLPEEHVWCLALNAKYKAVGLTELSKGTVNASFVPANRILSFLTLLNTANVILIHNHPSGEVIPSASDTEITKKCIRLCNLAGYKFSDHIICGNGSWYSFLEEEPELWEKGE